MRERTRAKFRDLPEVQRRNEEKAKRDEMMARRQRVKALDKKRRAVS